MDRCSSSYVVRLQCLVISQLFSRVNQSNLVHLDTLLFLQGLFDGEYLILWLKVEGLFAARQCFDVDLCWDDREAHSHNE